MQIFWAEETRDDFRRFHDFLDPENSAAAIRAAKTIREKTNILVDYPELGTALDDGTQRWELKIAFGKGNYVLRYIPDFEAERIEILRIWHSREERD